MGSAPGVTSMLTLPQKHVAEGAAAVDILAQPLRESSSAELSADARNMGGKGGGAQHVRQLERTRKSRTLYIRSIDLHDAPPSPSLIYHR